MHRRAPPGKPAAARLRAAIAVPCVLILAACAGTGDAPRSGGTSARAGPPETVLLDTRTLGALAWFDPARGHGVMRLYTSRPPEPGTRVETRGDSFRVTARWEVTPLRYGESIGLRLLEGTPAAGDAVTVSPHTDPDSPHPGS